MAQYSLFCCRKHKVNLFSSSSYATKFLDKTKTAQVLCIAGVHPLE